MSAGSAHKIIFEDDLAYLPGATERDFKNSAHTTWDGFLQALRSKLEASRGEHIREVANTKPLHSKPCTPKSKTETSDPEPKT